MLNERTKASLAIAGALTLAGCLATGELPEVENTAPVAVVGEDLEVEVGAEVSLDGSESFDPDDDTITYRWTLERPDESRAELSSLSLPNVNFEPDVAGTYSVRLIVNDGVLDSEPARVSIVAQHDDDVPAENEAPLADAGTDQNVQMGAQVQLDGTASMDPDGDPITYDWLIEGRPESSVAELNDPGSPTPTFVADRPGMYEVSLVVDDGELSSQPAAVIIEAFESNAPPNARAQIVGDTEVDVGTAVVLDGSASNDPDADALSFAWSFMSKPAPSEAVIQDSTSSQASFTPDALGEFVVELVVSDSESMNSDSVTVTAVEPVVPAVAPSERGQLVITEVMANPDALSDSVGEWFEIYNPNETETYDLQGCVIEDLGADSHTISDTLEIGPESYLTFAKSADPGFSPDHVFSGFLANGEDEIIVSCGPVGIADVAWGSALGPDFPIVAGESSTLPTAYYDEDLNDDGNIWCLSSQVYVTVGGVEDTGTPGLVNEHSDSCP